MKRRYIVLLLLVFVIGCQSKEEFILCEDGVTSVVDINDCPVVNKCPDCDDNNACTNDICNERTNFTCSYSDIKPCNGNGVCEQGEFGNSPDCPGSCDDGNKCTIDGYSYVIGECKHDDIIPCCGNNVCDITETFVSCEQDCEQMLDVKVTAYQRTESMEGSYYGSLVNTNSIYLIVEFKVKNILIERDEILDFREAKGFFYDPYKFKLEDENGRLYSTEYDSDLLEGWMDLDIVPLGHTYPGALLYVVPRSSKHMRLIAYDRYGNRHDSADIY